MYYKFNLEQISLISDKSTDNLNTPWLTIQAILAVAERMEAINQSLEAITTKLLENQTKEGGKCT